MSRIVAVTGFAGAGKSTAINFLESEGIGQRFYVGQIIIDALSASGLAGSPENEKVVRAELRNQHGPTYLAKLCWSGIEKIINSGATVLLDAVMSPDELTFYQARGNVLLISLTASFQIRSHRLSQREKRPLNREQLIGRDHYEIHELRIRDVIAAAGTKIANESSLQELNQKLIAACRY